MIQLILRLIVVTLEL